MPGIVFAEVRFRLDCACEEQYFTPGPYGPGVFSGEGPGAKVALGWEVVFLPLGVPGIVLCIVTGHGSALGLQAISKRNCLPLWGRWHGASRDGEGMKKPSHDFRGIVTGHRFSP